MQLTVTFREKLTEKHGALCIGRTTIPLHLTESSCFASRTVKMCEGWKIWMRDNDILMIGYNKLAIPISFDLIEKIIIDH